MPMEANGIQSKLIRLLERFASQDPPHISFRDNVRLLGTIYMYHRSTRGRDLGRGIDGVRHDNRSVQERRRRPFLNGGFSVCVTR